MAYVYTINALAHVATAAIQPNIDSSLTSDQVCRNVKFLTKQAKRNEGKQKNAPRGMTFTILFVFKSTN